MLLVAVIAVVGFGVPLALAVEKQYRDEALLTVSEEAARAVVAVPANFARAGDLPELPGSTRGTDVALYSRSGQRLVGTGPAIGDLPVTAALAGGAGPAKAPGFVVVLAVLDREEIVGAVRASLPPSVVTQRTRRAWELMGGLATAVLIASGGFAVDRSRRLARPLVELATDATLIGAGGEVPDRRRCGVAEIDGVHEALALAATRLNEALARERSFGADVAHQLRTPLASLRLQLETEQLQGGSDDALLEGALNDIERLQQTVDDLVALNRDGTEHRDLHPLSSLLADAVARWEGAAVQAGRALVRLPGASLPWTRVSPSAVRQILDVLISNALAHGSGTVRLSGAAVGGGAVLAVDDEGTAVIDPDEVFERRGKGATGSGIGLALARRLAEAEGMQLLVADRGPGVSFQLVIAGTSPPSR